jgi:LmbE family N-acetylglucosaminyl deacetylase
VFPLSFPTRSGRRLEILCIGAHCDDIEIGCGATILALQQRHPGCRIHWLVLTSNPARRDEAIASAMEFMQPASRGELRIAELPDGLLPAHFAEVKSTFESMKSAVAPDLVLTHHGNDRHQDHALASQVTWQTFRDHMIWEYEIPKYDGDLGTPNLYVPLPQALVSLKVETIVRSFESQAGKSWFTADNLLAAMRLRGLECRAPSGFAEAFHCRKLVHELGSPVEGSVPA